ncbi:efflux RND transporter periplasmic adaptor subunit [Pseudoalteromonas viridis]|uniref:Efflux RND transporter periplasmic adaptor subunit n=1 Tax=Pseudoalteromonas viridis TaxID=339617 RepID=A0ABX7VBM3_9GAMM|nr:efflux RND transporter periplasmic adaptor subunit [Pseudoalteromonas viridis]QTL36862.1 efflux RND transporter periplasmic adaptor subunit [Pseudoalteromonas viridis]
MLKLLLTFIAVAIVLPTHAAVPVKTALIQQTEEALQYRASAEVVSLRDVEIAAEVEGRVDWVAEVGSVLEKGAVLATIDPEQYQYALTSHLAYMEQLKSDIHFAQRALQRGERLLRDKVLAEQELDDIAQKLANARFALQQAEVDKRLLELKLARCKILAPFNGQVVVRHTVRGGYVEAGTTMLAFVDTDNKEVSAKLPVMSGAGLDLQRTQATLHVNGQVLPAKLKAIVQAGDEHSRLVEVRLTSEHSLPPISMPVEVQFSTPGNAQAWIVPRDAVLLAGEQHYVYQVSAQHQAHKVEIEVIGEHSLNNVLVKGALTKDRAVVVRGAEQLGDKQEVAIVASNTSVF